ncbi:MAG TPA: hypothetical protein VJS64_18135 [Pyrinomonadaceae bacterium]|nr:hypothetical protein [Pyrinomonadaceae bacterium]
MPYTAKDAQDNMNSLIEALQTKYDGLKDFLFTPGLTPTQKDIVNNQMAKLLLEIHHKSLLAIFDAASTTVIREPTPAEVTALQKTLTEMGKDLDSLANFQAVIKFVEDLMTQNAQRFNDILKTIDL